MLNTAGYPSYSPNVAMDANGNAIAVWQQYEDGTMTHANVYAILYNEASDSWGTSQPISSVTKAYAEGVAMDPGGNAVSAWWDSGTNSLFASNYSSNAWGSPLKLSTGSPGSNSPQSQIAIGKNGNAIAVWSQTDGIYANRCVSGTWGTAQKIANNTSSQSLIHAGYCR